MNEFEKNYLSTHFECKFDEPLKNHCSLRIGGFADCFCCLSTLRQLKSVMRFAKKRNIAWFILGNGTNVLFCDEGYRGIVIKLVGDFLSIKKKANRYHAFAGVSLPALCVRAKNDGLSGLEWAVGIPGTIGGAVRSNAGAFGGEMSNVVDKVKVVSNGKIYTLKNKKCNFSYRKSVFSQKNSLFYNKNAIIIKISFKLHSKNINEIDAKHKRYLAKRKETQPQNVLSAGSIFLRNGDFVPAKAIDDLGLKGFSINDAQVSKVHAGFIINLGAATCQDVLNLILYIRNLVYDKHSIILETEIVVMGERDELIW